ncbi:MAG: hypothetical protein ACTSRP_20485 [Candidatus Helarchaeota archaeon]
MDVFYDYTITKDLLFYLLLNLIIMDIVAIIYIFIKISREKKKIKNEIKNGMSYEKKFLNFYLLKPNIIRKYVSRYLYITILNFIMLLYFIMFHLVYISPSGYNFDPYIKILLVSPIMIFIIFVNVISWSYDYHYHIISSFYNKIFIINFVKDLGKVLEVIEELEKISTVLKRSFRLNLYFLIINFINIIINIALMIYYPMFFFRIFILMMIILNFHLLDTSSNIIFYKSQINHELKETSDMVKILVKRYYLTIIVSIILTIFYVLTPILVIIYKINLMDISYFQDLSYWIYGYSIGCIFITSYIIIKRFNTIKELRLQVSQ